jgi:hypothetical protein
MLEDIQLLTFSWRPDLGYLVDISGEDKGLLMGKIFQPVIENLSGHYTAFQITFAIVSVLSFALLVSTMGLIEMCRKEGKR